MCKSASVHSARTGLTLVELLISTLLLSVVIMIGFSGFQSFQNHAKTTNAIRTVTSALSSARYQAIEKNKSIKVCLEARQLVLKQKIDKKWQIYSNFKLGSKLKVSMNASPVFFPTGFVSPLCSIKIKNEKHEYKITLSIAGRIKVIKIV